MTKPEQRYSTPPQRRAVDDIARSLRKIERFLLGIFLMAVFTATYFAKDVLLPIVLGVLIALTLSPVVRWLYRRGVPRPISAVVLVTSIAVTSTLGVYAMSGPLTRVVREAPTVGARLETKLRSVMASVEQVQEASEQVEKITEGDGEPGVQQVQVRESSGLLRAAVGSVASAGTALFVAMILSMFLLAASDAIQRRIINALTTLHEKKQALTIVRDIERQISRYLGAITLINAGLGLCIGLAMHLLNMPLAWLWGVAAFLLNFLPFLGAMVGVAASAIVAILTYDSLGYALVVPLVYFALTAFEGQFVTPMLVGRRLELNVVAVFLTVMFWAWLWGVPGALMAVPFLVLLKVVCDHVPALRVLGSFLSDGSAVDPPAVAQGEAN
ncbi:AI-2E family transporter [Tranquillimonas alkanivorans]|uniref:Predicted PurR-regulated permease PerM n=1 Tax=Tranquillimonas alkanivorans TaxID=441119 RepID=A0A1I5PPA8_9RHOB|nr:AI-2E family transporter [Tranquillimonas alkanivorans]SFP35874.1 Predicted PurR-regulated permease PerM [Tranquillimonas alkanivorans]